MYKNKKELLKIESNSELEWLYINDVEYVDYGDYKRHLQLIVPYKPVWDNERFPVILFIQGSAWYKQDMYSKIPLLGKLAEYGYAIASAEIRESTIAKFPAQVEDIKTAIRFIKSKADDFHFDADNIFIFGESSGAHIGLLAGLTSDRKEMTSDTLAEYSCSVKGIIDFSGPTELNSCKDEDGGPIDDLMGANISTVPELAQQASCLNYISSDKDIPPIIIFHGENDPFVDISQSEMLYKKLIINEKKVDFYQIKGAGHGGKVFWTEEILNLIDAFIKKCISA